MLVTKPLEDTIATLLSELVQLAWEVMSTFDPSEYVPVAMNCCTEPTVKLVREIGVIEIEYNAITVKDIGWLVLTTMMP